VLLQEVRTEVDFCSGDHVLVTYRGYYAEYFRLDAAGTLGPATDRLVDLHAFDLRRDGWGQDQVMALLKRWGVPPAGRRCRQAPSLRLRKRFLLGEGRLHGAVPQLGAEGGAAFGVLASGPAGEAWGRLTATPLQGPPLSRVAPPLHGVTGLGHGHFTAESGWQAQERFEFQFLTLTPTLEARSYEPAKIAFVGASTRGPDQDEEDTA
jgi:hypothetical protein